MIEVVIPDIMINKPGGLKFTAARFVLYLEKIKNKLARFLQN
jgi:hypothetical protein